MTNSNPIYHHAKKAIYHHASAIYHHASTIYHHAKFLKPATPFFPSSLPSPRPPHSYHHRPPHSYPSPTLSAPTITALPTSDKMAAKKKKTAVSTPTKTTPKQPASVSSKRKATDDAESPLSVVTPTKKRAPGPKDPANRAPDVSVQIAPGTAAFVKRAEALDDWKGRVTMMWGQLFFVERPSRQTSAASFLKRSHHRHSRLLISQTCIATSRGRSLVTRIGSGTR